MWLIFLASLGVYALCNYMYDNLRGPWNIFRHALRKSLDGAKIPTLGKRYGDWAAVTGATDGIGKAYARELACQGLNVVLISRTMSKLRHTAKEIERDFKVRTHIIEVDFSKGPEVYTHIEEELQNLRVGILVNNVGQSFPGMLAALEPGQLWSVIYTNVGAVTLLSRLFMRRMHNSGIFGAIVNISSGTELQPTPYAALYVASKAFIRSLTLSLQQEARPYGITVQLVSPGFVRTKINSCMHAIMRGGLLIPEPETYAWWAVRTLGLLDETTGYFWHGLQTAVMKLFHWRLRTYVTGLGLQYLTGGNLKHL